MVIFSSFYILYPFPVTTQMRTVLVIPVSSPGAAADSLFDLPDQCEIEDVPLISSRFTAVKRIGSAKNRAKLI